MAYYGVQIKTSASTEDYINSLTAYGFILAADVKDGIPQQRKESVTIAGTSGEIDLSYVLTGAPIFGMRDLEFTLCANMMSDTDFRENHRQFRNLFHGQTCKVIMPWDTTRYYLGAVAVGEIGDYGASKFKVTVTAQPYLLSVSDDSEAGL